MAISKIENNSLASGVPGRSSLPAGTVLQVVQSYKNDMFSTNSTGLVVTGLSLSITPTSATSKILITTGMLVGTDNANQSYPAFALRRNTTQIGLATGATGNQTNATFGLGMDIGPNQKYCTQYISHQYLDSPATTSALTYDVYLIGNGGGYGAVFINRMGDSGNAAYVQYATSFITAMEVAA